MPASAVTAGAGAVSSIVGGVASGKGAKKAAKIQAASADKQMAALQAMYNQNKALMMPTYQNGQAAETSLNNLTGLGTDPNSAKTTLENMPGYQFQVSEALKGVNSNAYASGMGNSGAALKALQDRANGLAAENENTYYNQLSGIADRGVNAMNGLVSQGNQTTQASNTVSQNAANAASANAIYQGQNLADTLKGISGSAGNLLGSSYAKKGG